MKELLNTFWMRLFIVGGCIVATTGFALAHNWLWLPIAVICLVYAVWKFYLLYTHNIRKVSFLLDAIENNDPAIHFYENGNETDNLRVNVMLNRIARILYNVKIETVQKEKYYELILDFVETGIVVLNAKGTVFQKNRKALELLGIEVFTNVKQLSRLSEELEQVIVNVRPGDKQQVTYSTERGIINLLLRVSGICVKEEELRIIALSDINSELDDREIDSWIRLTRVLTHEIMNSLSPITSLSETLLTLPAAHDEEIKQGLETIHATGNGLINFVNSYRQLTRLPLPEPTLFYISPFLKRMVQLACHQCPCPHISIELYQVTDGLVMWADEKLLAQVVTNLLLNAIQAIGSNDGMIRLSAFRQEEKSIRIEVANNGPRIAKDMANQIFVPFFTTKEDGSGIGLSLSKQIMRICGGTLTLRPYSLTDTWTTFVITLNQPVC